MTASAAELLLLQKDQSWKDENWIVPLSAALDGLTAAQAAWRPQGNNLTIWQYVNHIAYYNRLVLNKLQNQDPGPQAATNLETFGEPGDPGQEQHWNDLVAEVTRISDALREQIASYTDDDLAALYSSENVQIGEQLASWMLHDSYHAGQIVLLRKLQGCWKIRFQ